MAETGPGTIQRVSIRVIKAFLGYPIIICHTIHSNNPRHEYIYIYIYIYIYPRNSSGTAANKYMQK